MPSARRSGTTIESTGRNSTPSSSDRPGTTRWRSIDFLGWAASQAVLFNPLEFIRWNVDKRYLLELERAGVPIVPTRFVGPGETIDLPPDWPEVVVKPSVSAGSRDTARYGRDDPAAGLHIGRLQAAGRTAMLQPYLADVETAGETSLIFIDGRLSHAIRKGPLLQPDGAMTTELFARRRSRHEAHRLPSSTSGPR